jgi:hypothetical protein
MANLILNGSTSGSVTLSSPAVSGTTTLTLPTTSGTVITTGSTFGGTGPAFSAYASASQSLANTTFLKLQFNTEEFDTNSNYDNATNYRFTPTVEGYYQVNSEAVFSAAANNTSSVFLILYKNGSAWRHTNLPSTTSGNGITVSMSQVIYLNGSTDYIEIYAYQNSGGTINVAITGQQYNYFQATMVRGA